jgi:hypothetical protein
MRQHQAPRQAEAMQGNFVKMSGGFQSHHLQLPCPRRSVVNFVILSFYRDPNARDDSYRDERDKHFETH